MACPTGGAIYTWTVNQQYQAAQQIPNAPYSCRGIMVADAQQMVIAYGVESPYLFTTNTVAVVATPETITHGRQPGRTRPAVSFCRPAPASSAARSVRS